MPTWISKANWGSMTVKDGTMKPVKRKPKDASEAIRWKKSKKQTCVTRAKARGFNRP